MSNSSFFLLKTSIFFKILEKYSATVSQLSALCPLDTQSQEQSSFYIKKKISYVNQHWIIHTSVLYKLLLFQKIWIVFQKLYHKFLKFIDMFYFVW